ncbi:MAG: hypothetical protein EHM40_11615 [Chloroflexi bacterium]|nr:MAG: hypothetical protein EHM40_11615 [Chloroflexota bacterium]
MSKLLSDLVEQLALDVPVVDSIPTAVQYENAVKDAVRDFSERCGLEQIATLNVVPGTATYTLASDFLKMIVLETFESIDGVIISSAGLIPTNVSYEERFTIRNGQITFWPTPTYTMARDYRYKAAWIGTDVPADASVAADVNYETMGEREARIILLKAQATALTKQANAQDGTSIKYSFGAVSEDLSSGGESLRKSAKALETEYVEACRDYNGQHAAYGD